MTTNTSQDLISSCLNRACTFAIEAASLQSACSTVLKSADRVMAQERPSERLVGLGTELHAQHALMESTRVRLVELGRSESNRLGWLMATYRIAPIARESGDEPLVFITGNAYMPPLRAFDVSDLIWALEDPGCWESYSEGVDRGLAEANVLMDTPEYDNALYVVDLARFEHIGDDDPIPEDDSLSAEWRPIARD
jgi:hypothetical protein